MVGESSSTTMSGVALYATREYEELQRRIGSRLKSNMWLILCKLGLRDE